MDQDRTDSIAIVPQDLVPRETLREKSWAEFQRTGLLFLINTLLHAFGWVIVLEVDLEVDEEEHKVVRSFPARTTFRGFTEASQDRGYAKVGEYLKDNAEALYLESRYLESRLEEPKESDVGSQEAHES